MFQSEELKTHLETAARIKTQSAIVAEWNMNVPTNIKTIGNYRYRKTESESVYSSLPNTFIDEDDTTSTAFYYGATDSDVTVDGTYTDTGVPTTLLRKNEKLPMLYSLEDCFKQFRPRSGINKARWTDGGFLHHPNKDMAKRPRYYMPDKNDPFKYWTSYRREVIYKYTYNDSSVAYGFLPSFIDKDNTVKNAELFNSKEYGISVSSNNGYTISDAVPFVVYKEEIPANRIIVKMQTGVGTEDLGTFTDAINQTYPDPFYGETNKATPSSWKIQSLHNNEWVDIIGFDSTTVRKDRSPIIGPDGYVEIAYGLKIPDKYKDIFIYAEQYSSTTPLPEQSLNGYAYLITPNPSEVGQFYIWVDEVNGYETFTPNYGWYLQEETIDRLTNFVTDLTSPYSFTRSSDGKLQYREFENISGIRVVVEKMNKNNCSFDLIELSPRLAVNLTDKVVNFSVKKSISDLGESGMPVGQLLSGGGTLEMFDYDDAFNINNTNSIVNKYISRHLQTKIYDIVSNVSGYDYYVPMGTLYSEGFPSINNADKHVTLNLRDMYFYFDSIKAPQTLMQNVSLSSAVCMLLDSIGFSNYVFKRLTNESEYIIPYFFVEPDVTVAEILQSLARSTQTAMFFDEFNNFIVMSKDYMLPSNDERSEDITLYGSQDFEKVGAEHNKRTSTKLSNIIELTSQDSLVYNGGNINYSPKYIQRNYGSIRQANLIDNNKTWIYKPALLWEVSGTDNTKSVNNEAGQQSTFMLSAIPLNSDISSVVPTVSNRVVINNTIDLGEGVYWLTRNQGLFYANGEVIKYDSVEYSVAGVGNVWISSAAEYEEYFSHLGFNQKIYPTGRIRIYVEPKYEYVDSVLKLKNGKVEKHGRGQFGTPVVSHIAGLNPYWYQQDTVRGCTMKSEYIFESSYNTLPTTVEGAAGINNTLAQKTTRNGVIKNFFSKYQGTETDINSINVTSPGTVQSSALVMNGPAFTTTEKPRDFISYVYKPLDSKFKHFGTRMRVIGKLTSGSAQSAVGSSTYYTITGSTPDKDINISGGSGGLSVLVNPTNNNGYYFEIIALGTNKITNASSNTNVNNVIFYKVMQENGTTNAIPVKLWEGLASIIVDDGNFTGQARMANETNTTVYDLGVEYEDIGTTRMFYLYINGQQIASVSDSSPLKAYNNMALFTRGSSRIMFENIYALTANYSNYTSSTLDTVTNSLFDTDELNVNESFRKYAMSGIVQGSYLTGIDQSQPPKYNIYFDEFGTIMREAATFNIKYDKAYPALYAKLSPTFNRIKGYSVSGFRAGSYGAEFMIFNATDTALSLDSSSGNYLRIQGVTFTQDNQSSLSVDDYYNKNSDFSNPIFNGTSLISSPYKAEKEYQDIKLSRMTYGLKDFSIDAKYIQDKESASSLMSWLIKKISKPRKSIGIKIFAMPMIQLGDVVKINYVENGLNKTGNVDAKYVVYSIDYSKDQTGPSMTVFLSEVE